MENFLLYIGKSALAAGAFYLAYLALFQNRKQFTFNRIYLPVSLALSFIIPLITFTEIRYLEAAPVSAESFALVTEIDAATVETAFQPEWFHYLFGIYLVGITAFLFHLITGHIKANSIIKKSKLKKLFKTRVNITKKDVHPFSFFSKIVLSEKTLSHPNLKLIVEHEKIHVKEKHTFDILFTEILFLMQWFNPFAWLIKDAVKNNLEYKTDHEIAKTTNPQTYQLAMVSLADKQGVAPFLTALNGSQLKNRIIMMKKKTENKYALLKQLVILPLLAVLVMGLSERKVRTKIIHSDTTVKESTTIKKVNNFLLSIHYHDNNMIIKGLEGCAFEELTFSIEKNASVAINQFGMYSEQDLKQQSEDPTLSDFLLVISRREKLTILTGNKGTNWDQLKFSYKTEAFVDKFGVRRQLEEPELIRGNVTNEKGEPFLGANIAEFDKFNRVINGTMSNINGQFILELTQNTDSATVKVMYPGYETKRIDVRSNKSFHIQLEPKKETKNSIKNENKSISLKEPAVFDPDIMPEYPGGENALRKYIADHIDYPKPALENGIYGKVYVRFIVSKTGEVTNAEIARGVDPALDKEALRVANSLPRWKPGQMDGKPVDVYYTVPVNFTLIGQAVKTSKMKTGKIEKENILYILDGKVFDGEINDIDPNTIENISVLKNKDALEIYGAKGKDRVIIITTKGAKSMREGELPIVLDGKMTGLTLNKVNQDLIETIKRIEPEEAVKKYGEKGINGVFEITSRNVSGNEDEERITTELELRKFIAMRIKYPVRAQEVNLEKTVYLAVEVDDKGKIKRISENASDLDNPNKTDVKLDEVVVTALATAEKSGTGSSAINKNEIEIAEKLLVDEAKRVVSKIPVIDMEEFKGKTVGMTIKFQLQE